MNLLQKRKSWNKTLEEQDRIIFPNNQSSISSYYPLKHQNMELQNN